MTRRNTVADFWDRTRRVGDCLIWIGRTDYKGYGQFDIDNTVVQAHRFAYLLTHGSISTDPDIDVCHTCDVPNCIEPSHLFQATHKENMHDAMRKGRLAQGVRHVHAKLTDDKVRQIRKEFVAYHREFGARALGRKYGVSHMAILAVVDGIAWKRVS